jgi:LmbE family N-acetylglucosaminyl deacetylase
VTNGDLGSVKTTKKETAAIRRKEAEAAAKIIDAEFYWMDIPDGFLFNTVETRLKMIDVIRQSRADLVIGHHPTQDYHPDHVTAGQLVWDSRLLTTVTNLDTGHPACESLPQIVYMDTAGLINVIPDKYVDISEDIETKKAMLSCHRSQDGWIQQQYGMTCVEMMASFARTRGFQCSTHYAEGFCIPHLWPMKATKDGLI